MYIREIIYSQARNGTNVYNLMYICNKEDRYMIYRARTMDNVDIGMFLDIDKLIDTEYLSGQFWKVTYRTL